MTALLRASVCILVLSFSLAAAAQSNPLAVGTASAAPGQRATGLIEVPAGVDAATSIPVIVINGAKPGPTLALVAGSHGTEYASIIALERLAQTLTPAQLSGRVIIVPLVNIASFLQKVPHVNPVDGKSMNRMYPGKPDGTQTERASWLITKQVVEPSDYLIDLHGGDLDENLRPYSYWSKTGNPKLDNPSRGMVLAFGFDHIIVTTDRPTDPNASRYLDSTATTRGKPAIAVEAGYAGTTRPEDIDKLVNGCLNVMRYLKMLPGTAAATDHPVWIGRVAGIPSPQTGVFYPLVDRGSFVAAGTPVGYVTDYFGNKIWEAHAPVAGVVLYICSVPSMKKDDNIANIGEIASAPY